MLSRGEAERRTGGRAPVLPDGRQSADAEEGEARVAAGRRDRSRITRCLT